MLSLPYNITCGYCDCSEFGDLTVSPKRKAVKFEIEYYLEDGLSTFVNDCEYQIKKDHIQIAKPEQVRYSRLPFKTLYLKFSAEGELAERLQNAPEYFASSHPEKTVSELREIILLLEGEDNELLLQSRLLSFLNRVLCDSEIPTLHRGQNYEIVARSKRFIEASFKESIKLNDVAASVNLSPIYFHNLFTAAVGLTPHDYLIDCRITEAKKLLWNSATGLDFIAQECGFGSAQYFNRIFKKRTGQTPGKYRKEMQQSYLED